MSQSNRTRSHWQGWGLGVVVLGAAIGLGGCDNLLEVNNPNNMVEEDLDSPTVAGALANGSLSLVADAVTEIAAPYSTASGELTWIGSRDAWFQLEQGFLADFTNEFSDAAFPDVAEARWFTDQAIERLEAFREAGELGDPLHLARTYLYGSVIYTTIADVYDDFAFSDRKEAAPPIGEENMVQLYDQAIEYTNRGLAIVEGTDQVDLRATLLAMRARAEYSKALWQKLNPAGTVAADPLVNAPQAAQDAASVLSLVPPDWKYQFVYSSNTVDSGIAFQVNQRGELNIGPEFAALNPEDLTDITALTLEDPIDQVVDPVIRTELDVFLNANQFAPFTVVSAREMQLILAETALAQGNTTEFTQRINAVRALNEGLSPFDPATDGIDPVDLLEHERTVNLFLQNRRLADLYRFGDLSLNWLETSTAARTPGTFFPIAIIERRANPHIGG